MSYPLRSFQVEQPEKLELVIDNYPLATVISSGPQGWPFVTQIPLYREGGDLIGHFDANNPQVEALTLNPPATCLFHGPNHYISPTIYPDQQYPGWNYVTVQVQAIAEPLTLEEVRQSLFRLAELNEPKNSGYQLQREQPNFDRFSTMIRGFRFQVQQMRGIFKLAQDKGPAHAELARIHLAERTTVDRSELLLQLLS